MTARDEVNSQTYRAASVNTNCSAAFKAARSGESKSVVNLESVAVNLLFFWRKRKVAKENSLLRYIVYRAQAATVIRDGLIFRYVQDKLCCRFYSGRHKAKFIPVTLRREFFFAIMTEKLSGGSTVEEISQRLIEWDENKNQQNQIKHRVDFRQAAKVFEVTRLISARRATKKERVKYLCQSLEL